MTSNEGNGLIRHALQRLRNRVFDEANLQLTPEEVDHMKNFTRTIEQHFNHTYPNETTSEDDSAYVYKVALPWMILLCVISIVINCVILISVLWIRKPLSPTLFFSVSLAGSDAYTSLILGTGLVLNSLLPVVYKIELSSNCYGLVLEAFRVGGIIVTVAHLLALAVNHYIGILRPLHYPSTVTRRTTSISCIFLWITPMVFFFIYFSSIENEGFQSRDCMEITFFSELKYRIVFSTLFFAPFIVMVIIYLHIYYIVTQHQHNPNRYQNPNQMKKNIKAIITTLLILGTYVIGWMPGVILYLLVCEDCILNRDDINVNVLYAITITCNVLIIIKTMLHPIIYAARMHEIKVALQRMRVSCCRPCLSREAQELTLNSALSHQDGGSYRFSIHSSINRSKKRTLVHQVKSTQNGTTSLEQRNNSTRKNAPSQHNVSVM